MKPKPLDKLNDLTLPELRSIIADPDASLALRKAAERTARKLSKLGAQLRACHPSH